MNKILRLFSVTLISIMLVVGFTTAQAGQSKDQTKKDAKTGNVKKTGGQKTIAVVGVALASEALRRYSNEIKAAATAKGWKYKEADSNGDYAKAVTAAENLIQSGVDAIVNMAVDNKILSKAIKLANEKNIPWVSIGGTWQKGVAFDIESNEFVGMGQMGLYIADYIDHKGNIILFTFSPLLPTRQRQLAFEAVVKSFPDMKIVEVHDTKYPGSVEDARQAMENYLLKYPKKGDIAAVWCAWDEPAQGASLAIQAAGRNEIIVTGSDGDKFAYDAIRQGTPFKATLANPPNIAGPLTVGTLEKIFNGQKLSSRVFYSPHVLVDKSNVPAPGKFYGEK